MIHRRASTFLLLLPALVLCGCAAPRHKPQAAPAASAAIAMPAPLEHSAPPAAAAAPTHSISGADAALVAPAVGPATVATADAVVLPLDSGARVFAALRNQLHTRACIDDTVVHTWMHRYARHPAAFAGSLQKIVPLLGYVVERVREAGLPGEFALLPIVESWYRPHARHRSTVGIWQFSPATARGNGLRVDGHVDERYAVEPATDAALSHLQALLERFGDWRLAVMAFNAGEYRIAGVLRRSPAPSAAPSPERQLPPGLNRITYEHLAKVLALACLVHEPGRVGLELPDPTFVPLQRGTLPVVTAAAARKPPAATYVVRSGDSLWAIARRHGVGLAELLHWNGLRADAVLHPGRLLRLSP